MCEEVVYAHNIFPKHYTRHLTINSYHLSSCTHTHTHTHNSIHACNCVYHVLYIKLLCTNRKVFVAPDPVAPKVVYFVLKMLLLLKVNIIIIKRYVVALVY